MEVRAVPDASGLSDLLELGWGAILVLDINLPDGDGFAIAGEVRRTRPNLGIVLLTGRDLLEDRIRGLEEGADLYLVKPVDVRELAAALRSLHRRILPEGQGGWVLRSLHSCLVTPGGVSVPLTNSELSALVPLVATAGHPVSREVLLGALGQEEGYHAERRLETLLSRLRRKVVDAAGEALPVLARHGEGYVFAAEVADPTAEG